MIFLSKDLEDLLELFNRFGVGYAVCGGHAVAHYGFVRMTMDLDLLVDPAPDNAQRVFEALVAFGFGAAGITVEDLQNTSAAITLGEPPNQINLLTRMGPTPVPDILRRARKVPMAGLDVPMIAREDLIEAKRSSTRPKDQIDLLELEKFENAS